MRTWQGGGKQQGAGTRTRRDKQQCAFDFRNDTGFAACRKHPSLCCSSFVCCLLFSVSFCLNSHYSASPYLPALPSYASHDACDSCLACAFSSPSISLLRVTLPCLLNSFTMRGRRVPSVDGIACNRKRILIGLTTAGTDASVH